VENTAVVKPYPGWKNAEQKIVEIVEREGYGKTLVHSTLLDWFDIIEPEEMTKEAWKGYTFEILGSTQNLIDSLLINHNIFIYNIRGEGYQILHPDDQVGRGVDKSIKRVIGQLRKAMLVLKCVNDGLLSIEGQRKRLAKITTIAKINNSLKKKIKVDDSKEDDAVHAGLLTTPHNKEAVCQGTAGCG
jgi:hypothetical protein